MRASRQAVTRCPSFFQGFARGNLTVLNNVRSKSLIYGMTGFILTSVAFEFIVIFYAGKSGWMKKNITRST
jgi:hypothetical protein